jgi:CHASE2 domain-containing sensor protein/signal transduction histidine kinase
MSPELGVGDKAPRRRGFRPTRIFLEWLLVGLIASGAASFLARSPLSSPFDRAVYDHLLRLRARTPSDRILIVAIDDASLTELGPWPWSRKVHAALLDRLTKAGVSAVAYDVLFLEPDPAGGDPTFTAALARSGRTILPVLQLAPGDNGRPVRSAAPLASLANAAAKLGQVNISPDDDGVVRRVSALAAVDGQCWEQLSLAALRLEATGTYGDECAGLAEASTKTAGLLADPPRMVPFAGPPGRFRTVSAAALVRGEVPSELLRGRFVLVGATAAGLGDQHTTASSGDKGAMAGVEVQANLLDTALTGTRIKVAARWIVNALSVMTIWILMLGVMRLRPRLGIALLGGLLGLVAAASVLAFCFGWWASPAPAMAGLVLAYPLWSWRRLATTSVALGREIDRFRTEETPTMIASGSDPLSSQINTLERVAQEFRQLHHMVADTLRSLPDPTVVVDSRGVIRLANALAETAGDATIIGETLETWLTHAIGRMPANDIESAFEKGAITFEVLSDKGASIEVSRAALRGFGARAGWTIVRLADVSSIRQAIRQREDALQLLTHDIRAPFASISAMASSAPQSEVLQRIDRYATRGRALADSYVQFSRAESADWPSTVFDLRDCVVDAADEIWAVAALRGVTITVEGPEVEILTRGDQALVTRAIMNLIDNAVRFSPDHGTVDVSYEVSEPLTMVKVCDRGAGVEPALRDKLFTRFVRGSDNKGGSGLGLAMAALVAGRMGGTVAYAPRADGGSTFELSVPTKLANVELPWDG